MNMYLNMFLLGFECCFTNTHIVPLRKNVDKIAKCCNQKLLLYKLYLYNILYRIQEDVIKT